MPFSAVESHYQPHTVLITPLQSTKVPFLNLQLKNQPLIWISSCVFWGQNCQVVNECSSQAETPTQVCVPQSGAIKSGPPYPGYVAKVLVWIQHASQNFPFALG